MKKKMVSVISCSLTNTYGHPSVETVERLKAADCKIGFTMESGAVRVLLENRIKMCFYKNVNCGMVL